MYSTSAPQFLCKHDTKKQAVTDVCVKHVNRSSNWVITAACVSSVLSSAQQGYFSGAQECEIRQKWYVPDHLRVFFIMAELYIRAITQLFSRSDVIAPSPMSLQLFPLHSRLLTLTWPVFGTRETSNGTAVSVFLPVSDSLAQGQAESPAPTPIIQ